MTPDEAEAYNRGFNFRSSGNDDIDSLRWEREVIRRESARPNDFYETILKSEDDSGKRRK